MRGAFARLALALLALLAAAAAPVGAAPAAAAEERGLPGPLAEVGFDQRLGARLPLAVELRDEGGAPVALGGLLGGRPAIVAPVYYDCPMLCTLTLNGLVHSLRALAFEPGRDFDVLVVSFDPRETPEQAAAAKATWVGRYGGDAENAAGWRFLTGSAEAIAALTDAIGFRFSYDEEAGEFAHAAGIVVVTPDGRVARYFYGIEYAPRDLRLGLVEAAGGAIGSPVDQVLLYCFRYDPATGRYSAVAMNLVRAGGVLTVAAIAIFLVASRRRERRLAGAAEGPAA